MRWDKEQREYEARQAARNELKFFEFKTDSQFGNMAWRRNPRGETNMILSLWVLFSFLGGSSVFKRLV